MLNLTAPSLCTLEVSQEINWSSRQDLHPGTGAHHFSFPLSPFYWFPLTSSHRLSTPSFWLPTPMLCGFRWRDLLLCLRLRWILCLALLPSDGLLCAQLLEGKSKVLDHLSKGDHKEPYVPPVSQLEEAQFAVKPLCYWSGRWCCGWNRPWACQMLQASCTLKQQILTST